MNIEIHPSSDRGAAEYAWLKARYSFSFANWFNPKRMGFGALRVLNDDIISGGKGFGMHPHDNMEIVTIVLSGAVEHKDSSGGHSIIKAGEAAHMSAGSGVTHSEKNALSSEPLSLLQIWVEPREEDISPSHSHKSFSDLKKNQLHPIVLGKKSPNALLMHQDGGFFMGEFDSGISFEHTLLGKDHGAYVFVISGEIEIDGKKLLRRDAAAISDAKTFLAIAKKPSQILVIDVPMS